MLRFEQTVFEQISISFQKDWKMHKIDTPQVLFPPHGRLFNDFFASKLSAFFGFVYHRKLFQCLKAISTHRVLKVKQDLLQKWYEIRQCDFQIPFK